MYKSQSVRRTVFADVHHNILDLPPTSAVTTTAAVKLPASPGRNRKDVVPKEPSSPPLPRQNSKAIPPSPPSVIRDMSRSLVFNRLGLLGEGGFARVYEVKDMRGARLAIKVVTKASLKTKKAKTKLYAEIKIHRSLQHPNIVHFMECFEDVDNVYMTLELCECGSVMDMLRRRRRFTEPESRFFMVQVIGACNFMHNQQIIHRDLKLGNLFLDANMNIKVGDFGLAALIENPGERKKTICGTPNYIAPEILFDTANGHSFEVDTWSIGVILYTLVIGRPPFQTKDVKTIYKRIRDNQYEWPVDKEVSDEAKDLVQQILTPDPQARPTLHSILDQAFFLAGPFPPFIPSSAKNVVPEFRHVSTMMSLANFNRARKQAWLDEEPSAPVQDTSVAAQMRSALAPSFAEQEREFQKAIQPGSPISALLSSARQPLLVAPAQARGEVPLIRKLQQAMPRDRVASVTNLRTHLPNIQEEGVEDPRKRELESQKARIVAQMAPDPSSATATMHTGARTLSTVKDVTDENVPPSPVGSFKPKVVKAPSIPSSVTSAGTSKPSKGYDAFAHVLNVAFQAKAEGKLFRDPVKDARLPHAKVFIVSWVDYCNKYGMGYALTDGSTGVYFNDSTSLLLSPDKQHIDYISSRRSGTANPRKSYLIADFPPELKSKIYLLRHFEKYMMDRLYGEYDYVFHDAERIEGMDYVQTYLRMKQVIVFKLSHEVLQFNFYDHSKLILSSQGLAITHIDKHYHLTHWTLSDVMRRSLLPPPADPEVARFEQKLVDKLRYAKEVLNNIKAAQENKNVSPSDEEIAR